MLVKMSEELYKQLQDDVKRIVREETVPFKILSEILSFVRSALRELKEYILKNPFKNEAEEIYFFKHIKPKFYCLRIFYLEWYDLKTSNNVGVAETLKGFYHDELKVVQHFFRRIAFHYKYYRLGATELDSLYFLRGMEVQSALIPEVPEHDPEFSTSQDYLFSKIKAYEMLQAFILKEIGRLDNPGGGETEIKLPKLQWTGEQVNLVELIYGIYYTGQLNHGNVEVKDIIALVEAVFQVEIKAAYHVFGNIRRRKSISPTAFMDKMREAILKRVDDDLAYHPNRDKLRKRV
jgi:hypothetical protein